MQWTCYCGKHMSNTLCPSPDGYEVYSEEEMDKIWDLPEGVDALDYRDFPSSKIDAYVCPDCGRIMVFKKGEDHFYSYAPEPKSPLEKLFTGAAWKEYIRLWEKEESKINDLSDLIIEQIRKEPDGEITGSFYDEDVRLGHIGDYCYHYIYNPDSGGILLIDTVKAKNLEAHNRIQNAVEALGGELALDDLPEYFREKLLLNDDLEAKAGILEALVEIKKWV